ncbi:MAG: mechanosensitive ion channel family protein [Acidimicrobiales bacterium]
MPPSILHAALAAHSPSNPVTGGSVTTLTIVILAVVAIGAFGLHLVGFSVLKRVFGRPGRVFAHSLVRNAKLPTGLIVPLVGLEIALAATKVPDPLQHELFHAVAIAIIFAVAFLAIRLTYVLEDMLLERHRIDTADNLRARQLHTQIQILRRVTVVVVAVIALAAVLLSFREVRIAGAGLLASAGLVGIVAGVAARPTVANVVAGLQIAFSQPIRVDDVVVVESQWGRVEQIALTYVVVRLWDLRRLVLPISYFVENPFENWTRSTADIVGWVYIEVDHSAPVDLMRDRLHEILRESANWDGNTWNLQVSNAGTSTIQLRAIMSSPSSAASWDLQCEVREKLVAYLRDHHPGALPRIRTETAMDRFEVRSGV